jgi:hypothetical protein
VKGVVVDSSCNGSVGHQGSPTKVTLRSNQLAAVDENADYGEVEDENIYQEASTLTINNSSTKTRNRKVSFPQLLHFMIHIIFKTMDFFRITR